MYTFKKLHDRRIPNVGVGLRVGVGPVVFQLIYAYARSYFILRFRQTLALSIP